MQNNRNHALMSRPIHNDELRGAVVLATCLFDLQDTVEDIKTFTRHAIDHQMQILKAFGDLYLELTGETERRRFLEKRYLQLEREAARLKLPIWFWRPEPGKSLHEMVSWRAKFLIHRQKASLDDIWDLLTEFMNDYARCELPDDELASIIEAARAAEVV